MERPTCKTCLYWTDTHLTDPAHPEDGGLSGQCHRFPIDVGVGEWPGTNDEEWCGEHPDVPAWIAHKKAAANDQTLLPSIKVIEERLTKNVREHRELLSLERLVLRAAKEAAGQPTKL